MSENSLNIALRPRSFSEVVGSVKTVAAIQELIAKRIPRAFFFSGAYGCGKTTTALLVARAVQGPDFPAYQDPEVLELNAGDHTGVDDIRPLIAQAAYKPFVGRYRVFILNEAHKLSEAAQSALLVPLESPEAPSVWILTTTHPAKVLKGLKDRSQAFDFPLLNQSERHILVQKAIEATNFEGDALPFLTALSENGIGSPREILTAFERFAAGLSAEEAILGGDSANPDLFEAVKQACFGNWSKTFPLLAKIGADESRSKLDSAQRMQVMAAGFLRSYLVPKSGNVVPSQAKAAALAMKAILDYSVQPSDSAFAWPAFNAALYVVATHMAGANK